MREMSVYAKVGTIPMNIVLKNSNPQKGDRIEWRENRHGSKWERGIVDDIEPLLFIERM